MNLLGVLRKKKKNQFSVFQPVSHTWQGPVLREFEKQYLTSESLPKEPLPLPLLFFPLSLLNQSLSSLYLTT